MESVKSSEEEKLDLNDPELEVKLVNELKEQGIFDQLRKDCLADVDTKPGYQNLKQRVDSTLDNFIKSKNWEPKFNKNQLRAELRKQIEGLSGKDTVIDRLVDQCVDPKLHKAITPEIESLLLKYFGSSLDDSAEEAAATEDVEMANGDNSVGEEGSAAAATRNGDGGHESDDSGPGLAGQISPITPGREDKDGSPTVEGNISPLTPSNTPPQPQSTVVDMEIDHQVELPSAEGSYTPPLPQQSYTPPPRQSAAEESFTPPLPAKFPPPPPPAKVPSPSMRTPPPPPGEIESGGEASMSSISDTEIADLSPPHRSPKSPVSSPTRHIPLPAVRQQEGGSSGTSPPDTSSPRDKNTPPQKGNMSDSELDQLEKMRAELMAKLEGDFKLSPEEDTDSEGELDSEEEKKSTGSTDQDRSPKPDSSPEQDPPQPEGSPDQDSSGRPPSPPEKDKSPHGGGSPEQGSRSGDAPSDGGSRSGEAPSDIGSRSGDAPCDGRSSSGDAPCDGRSSSGDVRSSKEESRSVVTTSAQHSIIISPIKAPNTDAYPSEGEDPRNGHSSDERRSPIVDSDTGDYEKPTNKNNLQQALPYDVQKTETSSAAKSAGETDVAAKQAATPPTPTNQLQTVRSLPLPTIVAEPDSRDESGHEKHPVQSTTPAVQCFTPAGPYTPVIPATPVFLGVTPSVTGPQSVGRGPRTPEPQFSPEPDEVDEDRQTPSPTGARKGPTTPPEPPSPPSPLSAFGSGYWRPPSPKEVTTTPNSIDSKIKKVVIDSYPKQPVAKEKKDKTEKKSDKIKEQQKAKLAKMEQKVKSKDKLKSDKYQDLDIFSTTKRPVTPYQPYRPPSVSGSSVHSSPQVNGTKPVKPNAVSDSGKKLSSSLKEAAAKLEQVKGRTEFTKPGRIPERRGSADSKDSREERKSKHPSRESSKDKESKSRRSSVDTKEKSEKLKDKNKDKDSRVREKDRLKDRERDKSKHRRESEEDKKEINKQKDRESYYEESRKRLAEMRLRKEKEEREKKAKEEKKKSKETSKDSANLKDQLNALKVEDIQQLLLKTMEEKTGVSNAKLINELGDLINRKKAAQKEPSRKRKEASVDEDNEDEAQPEKKKRLSASGCHNESQAKGKKRNKHKIESSDSEIEEILVVKPDVRKDSENSMKSSPSSSKSVGKSASNSPVKPEEPKKLPSVSQVKNKGKQLMKKVEEDKPEKKDVKRTQSVERDSESDTDSDSDSGDISELMAKYRKKSANEAKSSESVAKEEKSGRRISTRGVKVNLNRLDEKDLYKYNEGASSSSKADVDSDSDSDFEIHIDHVAEKEDSPVERTSEMTSAPTPTEPEKSRTTPAKPTAKTALKPSLKSAAPKTVKTPDRPAAADRQARKSSAADGGEERVVQRRKSAAAAKPAAAVEAVKTPGEGKEAGKPRQRQPSSPRPLPAEPDFIGFPAEDIEFLLRAKEDLNNVIQDEDNISVSSVSSDDLNAYIPPSRTIEIDLPSDCNTEALLNKIDSLGGGARTYTPVPQWLKPYIIGAKCKPDELEVPSMEEVSEYLEKNQKKAKKRGKWDIVVEWVPAATQQKKTKAERELRNDPFSTFFSGLSESGGKRARRANHRYSSAEYSANGELGRSSANKELDRSSSKEEQNTGSPSVVEQETAQGSAGKMKSSKDRIKAYLKSAGVDRPAGDLVTSPDNELKSVGESAATAEHTSDACDSSRQRSRTASRRGRICDNAELPLQPAIKLNSVKSKAKADDTVTAAGQSSSKLNGSVGSGRSSRSSLASQSQEAVRMSVDEELQATEEEMKDVLKSLKNKKKGIFINDTEEFFGWSTEEISVPVTAVELCRGAPQPGLEEGGAKIGLSQSDILGRQLFPLSDGKESTLEIVMSPAIMRDLKKADSPRRGLSADVRSDLLRQAKDDLQLRNGSDGSDSDEKGSSSPSSSGSSKENQPTRPRRSVQKIMKEESSEVKRGMKRRGAASAESPNLQNKRIKV